MDRGRLEAFSDGVIAIIITIMVLELHAPASTELAALRPLLPTFGAYALSFVLVGIYWNNHHHMLQLVKSVNGPILWGNLHLLFWLSLTPFATAWLGSSHLQAWPVALYAALLFMDAIAYTILAALLVRHEGPQSQLARAFGRDYKGKLSLVFYVAAMAFAFFLPIVSIALILTVSLVWFLPDRRVEKTLGVE